MDITLINDRIKKEICYNTINELTDNNLINEYKNSKSVKNKINKLNMILDKYIEDKEIKIKIINDYILELIPPGTKGVIKGNKFNNIIKKNIIDLKLNIELFEFNFDKQCKKYPTSEIPDWYILEKSTNKIIIGMNQLDLWGGGHQTNRGFKYLIDNIHNNKNSKLLCVVCNEINLKNTKNKTYKLFDIGFKNDTLCYLNNLDNIIKLYFNLD